MSSEDSAAILSVPDTFRSWFTAENHDLIVFPTRLVSVRAPTFRARRGDARVDSTVLGPATTAEERRDRIARRTVERLMALEQGGDPGPDAMVIALDGVARARLRRSLRVCRLEVTLDDGRKERWMWWTRSRSLEAAHAAFERVLGDRLR